MTNLTNSTLARLLPLAAATILAASACEPSTTTSSPADAAPATSVVESAPPTTQPLDTVPPATDAPVVTDAPLPTDPPAPTSTCGEFGDIPPVPDSMTTQFFDTNGDDEPDAVTAYAGHGHPWTLRIVENGITSEAEIPDVVNYAAITGVIEVESRDRVLVRDFDTDDIFTFATDTDGCVELVGTEPAAPPAPVPTVEPVIAAAPCGTYGPIPPASQITSDLTVDLTGDGTADDRVVTYLDGDYKLRTVRNGVISEVVVPDVGVSSIRALGVGNAGEISRGNEIVVRTGGGASSAEIGIFGHDAAGCVFQFDLDGEVLALYVGATIGTSSGMFCGEGVIAEWYYELDDDGTYFGSSAGFFESTAGNFTYLLNSDDFSEGLALEDLAPAELDCFGFGL